MSAYDHPPADPEPQHAAPRCPRCQGPLERVHRRLPDRVLSLVLPVRRYRCNQFNCQWEGLRRRRRRLQPARA